MSAFDRLSRMCGPQVPPELLAELNAHRAEVRTETLNEAIQSLHEVWRLAPESSRADGINFAIGALMSVRDHPRAVSAATTGGEPELEQLDLTPIPLRWDRLVMHPAGDDDRTIVCCMTDDGRPAALFLDDEHREALGLLLVDPNGDEEQPETAAPRPVVEATTCPHCDYTTTHCGQCGNDMTEVPS